MIGILEGAYKYSPEVDTTNLVASYATEETTGPVVDSYGGFDGVLSGTATRGVAGKVGNTYTLTNAEIRIPHNAAFSLRDTTDPDPLNHTNKNLAFSFWLYLVTASEKWFFNKRSDPNKEYQLSHYLGDLRLQIWNTDGTQVLWTIPYSFTAGQWYHLSGYTDVATNNVVIKVNNVTLAGTVTGTFKTINTTTEDFVIGRAEWTSDFRVIGRMDEFRFWVGHIVPTSFTNEWNKGSGITL